MKSDKLIVISWLFVCFLQMPLASQNRPSPELSTLLREDSIARTTGDMAQLASVNEKIAIHYYQHDPVKSIAWFEKAAILCEGLGNYKHQGYCLQNTAFAYDEKLGDFPKAIEYAQRALVVWSKNKDVVQIANILKYIGLLKGKVGQYSEAKGYLQRAIEQYITLDFKMGLAVSYFDLALVYEHEQQLDSSLYFLNEAKEFWWSLNGGDVSRIFPINNALFRIYLAQSRLDAAFGIFQENEPLAERAHWQQALAFYEQAQTYFEKRGDHDSASVFWRNANC